ncbi:bromodomain-containing protein 9 isoform X3 [Delphinapterus leucas]|uniref:Bromodomain-containing protein 9 n=1 Tax=Delphinapterus leucas TaxID=9749 RepID=A0A2Y9P130_DELLE|nr:bromodomain-containing protein 9 isoform X3 [Delphinapterus leucas]
MGKKHKKHKAEWRSSYEDYADKPLEKPLKLVLKVGGSEVTELSGSGHDSSYYDDRSDHERERHKEKKKKKKKKSEKEKHLDDEERRKRKEEKKRKREKEHCDTEGEADDFDPGKKVEVEPPPDRPVRACRTQPAENESTPIQQLLEHFLRQLQRKDPHGFFAFPVTDAIAPGYSMIIKHPMDFGTMRDKIVANEYKSVTEFKADFKLMCDNAMTYNRPDTVYYKLAKKILHAGFKMMSKAALLGNEDTAVEEPVPEVVPVQVETAKKSKRPSREVISCMFEPEGNACSLTDSTAEEHVLALVEHAADEARDRINRLVPGGKMGYLKKNGDGSLLYSVVNTAEPDADGGRLTRAPLTSVPFGDLAPHGLPEMPLFPGHNAVVKCPVSHTAGRKCEEETHPVDLSALSSKLLPGFTALGFREERRSRVTFLSGASTALSTHNNSVFGDLKCDEVELLYSAYGDETGVQCALSLQEFVKDAGSYSKKLVDDLLDQITGGDHSRMLFQLRQRRSVPTKPLDEVKAGDPLGDGGSTLDFMAMKSYSDVSLDISVLGCLGRLCRVPPGGQGGSALPIGCTMKTPILRTPQVTADGACPALLSDLRPHPWESSAGVPPPASASVCSPPSSTCAHWAGPIGEDASVLPSALVCQRGPPSPSWPVVFVVRLLPSPFRPAGRTVRLLGGLAQGSSPRGPVAASGDVFGLTLGTWCFWSQVDRGQRCC